MIALYAALLQTLQGANTTPASGDTVGYWQQRIAYTIVAQLDEPAARLRARGELVYVNNSPDTLHEMYFHQYLNAFRPGSKWSEVDEREGRVRFQNLRDPDYGYERFTAPPTVAGVAVRPEYPGAPDSTVVRLTLPRPLAPHDSVRVSFAWDARPSTVPRRQGRRGRSWDFAQWYPKVAVYDRGGWEPNALVPAGELYGEFGTYDVTMVVANDQVIGSTGAPVSGDPGWERVRRWGDAHAASATYDSVPPAPTVEVPDGYRAVRFLARDVHMFAWTASPDYRYEGTTVVRLIPSQHFKTWDTVAVNVLYKPGDDTTWGGGRAVNRTVFALKWLESIWGPYAYPQITNVHRIEGGGTEFPMMVMDGSASQGLILHEAGHLFTYGILANNEWRSGWMDEGLTTYQTAWAEGATPQEMARTGVIPPPPRLAEGYRVNAVTIPPSDIRGLSQLHLELLGRAQPIGTNSADFREFGIYNAMIYDRAALMYGQLRDVLGDDAFRRFFHDYYTGWALKHVDERAMRASAERASGQGLGWFFDQWVHHTGLTDYALGAVDVAQRKGGWVTRAELLRRGDYHHPMPVGVRTGSGWTFGRGDPLLDRQTVEILTAEQPAEIRLDPYHVTWDWDRRNNVPGRGLLGFRAPRVAFDWPLLDQADRDHSILALSPELWYGSPLGVVVGARARSSYLTSIDRYDVGAAVAPVPRHGVATASRFQLWARTENPDLPWLSRPLMGQRAAVAFLDGIFKVDWSRRWDESPFFFARGPQIAASVYATGAYPTDRLVLPDQWDDVNTTELGGGIDYRTRADGDASYTRLDLRGGAGLSGGRIPRTTAQAYERLEGSATRVTMFDMSRAASVLRVYGGVATSDAPIQRTIFASTLDPFATFENNLVRPAGALFRQEYVDILPLGGAALRGYSDLLAFGEVVAGNAELARQVATVGGVSGPHIWLSAFGDLALAGDVRRGRFGAQSTTGAFADAGVGASLRGRLYDRDVRFRLDFPILVNQAGYAIRQGAPHGSIAARYLFSFTDLW